MDISEGVAATLRSEMHGHSPVICLVYDARGNGGGSMISTLTGDHQNRITDYTTIVVIDKCNQEPESVGFDAYQHHNWRESDTIGPLTTAGSCIRGDTPLVVTEYINSSGNGIAGALDANYFKGQGEREGIEREFVVYPAKTGALCANSHPGSYSGQDAYNDMLIVIKEGCDEGG